MTIAMIDGSKATTLPEIRFWPKPPRPVRCAVRLIPEEAGGYSVYVPQLPGVVSEGATIDESLASISEALRGALAVYAEDRKKVPWQDSEQCPGDEIERWVMIDG